MICLSVALFLLNKYRVDKLRQKWEQPQFNVAQRIEPATEREILLKKLLLNASFAEREYMLKYLEAEFVPHSVALLFCGVNFVSVYFMQRRFIRLIRKLQKS